MSVYASEPDRENPWIQVDLQNVYKVTKIRIYNRLYGPTTFQLHSIAILFSYDSKKFEMVVYNNEDNYERWILDFLIRPTDPTTRYMG